MMMRLFLLLIVFSFQSIKIAQHKQELIPWPTLGESPWPMISHDPQFTGRSQFRGPQTPNIIWTKDLPDGIFSGPVIGEEGNLYFGSYYQLSGSDNFYSVSPTGEEIWMYNTESDRPPQTGILVDSNNTIYFGSLDKYIYALNSDGTLKWKYETSNPIVERVNPNIDLVGRIYITNGMGELYSINPDRTLNWNKIFDSGFYGKSPVFSPDGNTIYISGKENHLYAINLDGSLKWRYISGNIPHLPLVDFQGNIYITPEEIPQYFYCLTSDGEIKWKSRIISEGGSLQADSSPTIDKDGNIYALLWDSTHTNVSHRALFSFTYEGENRWTYIFDIPDDAGDDFWQPLICDSEGTIYLGSSYGTNYYAISSDGELKWQLPLNEYQVDNTGAISSDGTLYIGVHKSSLWSGNEKNLIAIKDSISTDVYKEENEILDEYELGQNFPNPFNPKTAISYQLLEYAEVRLKIFDVLGREISVIENGFRKKGIHSVVFLANNLPSGMYFYHLRAGEYSETKKMILMK